jgi:zinc/manganese transport system substrate-binding protein
MFVSIVRFVQIAFATVSVTNRHLPGKKAVLEVTLMKNCRILLVAFISLAVGLLGQGTALAQTKALNVVATITIIQDIAKNVAGDKANVDFLVPTDGDVHEFQPSPADVRKLADADLILVNGVGLEQFLDKLIADSGTKAQVVVVSRGLGIQKYYSIESLAAATPEQTTAPGRLPEGILGISGSYACGTPQQGGEIGECDPHLWQNVTNVIAYTLNIRDALSAVDPANADTYNLNAGVYITKLQKLDADIFAGLAAIPAANRVLVTNHDALGYFATRYGFQIAGVVLPGGTTGQEPDPKQIADLIETIQAKQVKALFLENVSSEKMAQQIADEAGMKVIQALYTDALGAPGTPGETYLGMEYANLKTLQDALK